MPPSPSPQEPRLARVAAVIADPARSRMLAYLLSGELASASELARAASVQAPTASAHLARMVDAGFLVCEPRGRHRYFRLADAEIAQALEALALVAERSAHAQAWSHPERARLRQGRCCYGHLAGRLGVRLFDLLWSHGCLRDGANDGPTDGSPEGPVDGLRLTERGRHWLASIGLDPSPPTRRRRYAYRCLDWSERRDHLAGQLADELYAHAVARGWLRRGSGRSVELTAAGARDWLPPPADDDERTRETWAA